MTEGQAEICMKQLSRLLSAADPQERHNAAKALVVLCWPEMRLRDQEEFYMRLDDNLVLDDKKTPQWRYMLYWPFVLKMDLTKWERDFAERIEKRRKFESFDPSEKEWVHIKRLLTKMHIQREEERKTGTGGLPVPVVCSGSR